MTTPYYIDWAITNKCDLSCAFCTGVPKEELSTQEALTLASQIVDLEPGWVIVEGGEPFLRGDLPQILKVLTSRVKTYIITNGNSLDENFLRSLPVTRIIISLDGASKNVYETIKGGNFNKVMYGMKMCAEMGILDGIVVVLSNKNFHQIRQFFEVVADLKPAVSNIIFIPLMPTDKNYYMENLLTPLEQKEAISAIYKYTKAYEINAFYDEPFIWAFGKSTGVDITCESNSGVTVNECKGCAVGKSIYIQADGDIRYCMFSPPDLAVGNVRKNSLKWIWEYNILNSPLINEFKDRKMRNGKCKSCVYFEICYGCLSRIFRLSRTHLESDPACPLAIRKENSRK